MEPAIHIPTHGRKFGVPNPKLTSLNNLFLGPLPVLVAKGELYIVALCFGSHHQLVIVSLEMIQTGIPRLDIIVHCCNRLIGTVLGVHSEVKLMASAGSRTIDP